LSDASFQAADFASSRRMITALAEGPFTLLNGAPLTTTLSVPWERLSRGPTGGRFSTHIGGEDAPRGRPLILDSEFEDIAYSDRRCPADLDELVADRKFLAQHAYAVASSTLALFESTMGRRLGWKWRGHRLALELFEPISYEDSGYDGQRGVIRFGHAPDSRVRKHVPLALYRDVVTHEVTHAIIDGYRPHLADPDGTFDEHAMHEAMADIVAMLSVFSSTERVVEQLQATLTSVDGFDGKEDAIVQTGLFGIADGLFTHTDRGRPALMGSDGTAAPGVLSHPALRRVVPEGSSNDWRSMTEPHERGTVFSNALMDAVLVLWKTRNDRPGGRSSEYQIAQSGSKIGRQMLAMLIRGLGYTPPIDVTFDDLLRGILAADLAVMPDDSQDYRGVVRAAFAPAGITAPPDDELDGLEGLRDLRYPVRLSALASDPEEVYRFLWENPAILRAAAIDPDVNVLVERVRPSLRVAPDGFVVSEIGASFVQQVPMSAYEARNRLGLRTKDPVVLRGGGLVRFNEGGRLSFAAIKPVLDADRQQQRLDDAAGPSVLGMAEPEVAVRRAAVFDYLCGPTRE
jgi:hypothetical protein